VGDPNARIDGHSFEKSLDHPGLPDARLTSHEDDLARTAPRRFDPSMELVERRLAADEMSGAAISGATGGIGPDPPSPGRRVSLRPGINVGDAGDESIPAAVNRRHEARRPDSIAQRLPDLAHADLQHRIAYGYPRPNPFEQEVLREELTVALDQTLQDGKGLRRQPNRLRPPPETRIVRIEPKRRETELSRRSHIHQHRLTEFLPRAYDRPIARR